MAPTQQSTNDNQKDMNMTETKLHLTNADINLLAVRLANAIRGQIGKQNKPRVYGIPRGGVPALYALSLYLDVIQVDSPELADIFVDDIIDSGSTMRKFCDEYPGRPFYALIDKTSDIQREFSGRWIVFPWETNESGGIEDNIRRMLQYVGEDPDRGGLLETPKRVAKAWNHWCSGYGKDPAEILKVFEDGAESCDEMVVVKDIPFYTHCEHHMAPFFGTATIAYIPDGRIVGLSKLSRLLDMYARRLQVQERLTNQVADALFKHLQPKGVGVQIRARHMCMESRGVCQQGHHTVTNALRGVIKEDAKARAEFMEIAK